MFNQYILFNFYSNSFDPVFFRYRSVRTIKLFKQEGPACYPKLKDPKGEFRFGDGKGYVWVQDINAVMLMHPIKPSLDGKGLMDFADANGTYMFVACSEIAEEKGADWVPYVRPKPGEKKSSPKIFYVKLVKIGDKNYVIGSGMYDITVSEIKKMFPNDPIYKSEV